MPLPSEPRPAAPPQSRRPVRWHEATVVASTVVLAALWAWRFGPAGDAELKAAICAGAVLPLALLFLVVIWLAPKHEAVDAPTQRAWRVLALAVATWWVSGVLWAILGRHALSWADPVQMLFVPLVLRGVFGFPAARVDRATIVRLSIDTGVVVLGGLAGVWYFVLWPLAARGRGDATAMLVSAAYPVTDVVLLLAACVVMLRHHGRGARRAMGWVALGLVWRFAGDVVVGWQQASGSYREGGVGELTWLTACWALAVGACMQRRTRLAGRADAGPTAAERRGFSLLPYASVAFVYAFLLFVARGAIVARTGGVLLCAVGVTALVLVRQFLVARDNVRLQRERLERDSAARFRALVQQASDVICVVDAEGRMRFVSPSVARVLGMPPETLLDTPFALLVHPEDLITAQGALVRAVAEGTTGTNLILRVRHADGDWRSMECACSNLLADPTVGGIVVTARDVTERAALQAQLVHQAFHDPLTRLANRALFRDRVEHALARANRHADGVAVLFLDLDDFKTINDSLGHLAGDRLLSEVGGRLLNATRGCDTVARLGGDEFAVLLENVRVDGDAVTVAERVVRALRAPMFLDGNEVVVGASVGIAMARPEDGADELLRNADVAMYRAKGLGKGGYQVYDPEMHVALRERVELEADLRRALADPERAEFSVVYQPIVELDGGRVSGAEALVRWQHPRRGLLLPASFIPIAEATGLIVPLGAWVLRQACGQAAAWQAARDAALPAAPRLTITVNISSRQLQEPGFGDAVAAELARAALPPASLVLEITESVLMHDTEANQRTLEALRALGVRLAIDDFGTGYSSLSYLQRFPIDILKIDRAFINGIEHGGSGAALARTIVALGDMLAVQCVAEGIEHDVQHQHLRAIGCGFGQGYHFSHPLSAEAAGEVLCGAAVVSG